MRQIAFALCFAALPVSLLGDQAARGSAPAGPVLVIDTAKGSIEIELFQSDAPKSVDHIVRLVKRNFYRSQRFHRVEGFIVQFGDQSSRDMTQMRYWGLGGSNSPIGVAEISKRQNVRGTVGLAHSGNATMADSQIYILKGANATLNGKYTVIGRVAKGMDVVDKIEKADLIKLVTIREVSPAGAK